MMLLVARLEEALLQMLLDGDDDEKDDNTGDGDDGYDGDDVDGEW